MRGFLSGLIWGGLVSVVVLTGAAIVVGPPNLDHDKSVEAREDLVSAESSVRSKAPQAPVAATDRSPGDLSPLSDKETQPATTPSLGDDPDAPLPPVGREETPEVSNSADSPIIQPDDALSAPMSPKIDSEASISADPVQPIAPEVSEEETAFAAPVEKPVQPQNESAASLPAPAVQSPGEETVMEIETVAEPEEPVNPTTGVPTESVTDQSRDDTAPVSETNPEEVMEPLRAVPPLVAFAEPVEVAGDRPLMAIVLIDDGSEGIVAEALASFPYPLSIAVDASHPEAEDMSMGHREKGFEVLALIDLPEGAQAQNAEVTLDQYMPAVPEAVALMDGLGAGVQQSRESSDQTTAFLADSGHGLLLFPRGLNTVEALARKSGVATATVFRDFDGKGQNPRAILRFLDSAALKAGQTDGAVVMVGRLRPDTISALLIWGLQERASSVTLVPVSQALRIN